MGAILNHTQAPLGGERHELLSKLIESPGFQVLKEVLSSNAARHALEGLNWSLNISRLDNESGEEARARSEMDRAMQFRITCDLLDEIAGDPSKWYDVTVETRK